MPSTLDLLGIKHKLTLTVPMSLSCKPTQNKQLLGHHAMTLEASPKTVVCKYGYKVQNLEYLAQSNLE
jgi:hypothetical protein